MPASSWRVEFLRDLILRFARRRGQRPENTGNRALGRVRCAGARLLSIPIPNSLLVRRRDSFAWAVLSVLWQLSAFSARNPSADPSTPADDDSSTRFARSESALARDDRGRSSFPTPSFPHSLIPSFPHFGVLSGDPTHERGSSVGWFVGGVSTSQRLGRTGPAAEDGTPA